MVPAFCGCEGSDLKRCPCRNEKSLDIVVSSMQLCGHEGQLCKGVLGALSAARRTLDYRDRVIANLGD